MSCALTAFPQTESLYMFQFSLAVFAVAPAVVIGLTKDNLSTVWVVPR